jgi:hypothetical protein
MRGDRPEPFQLLDEKKDAIRRVLSAGGAVDFDVDEALAAIEDLLGRYTRARDRESREVPLTVRRNEAKVILEAVEKLRTTVGNSSDLTQSRLFIELGELSAQDKWVVGRYLYFSATRSLRDAARRSFVRTQSAVAPGRKRADPVMQDVFNHLAFIWQTHTGRKFVATSKSAAKSPKVNAQLQFFTEVFAAAKISHPSAQTTNYMMREAHKAIQLG